MTGPARSRRCTSSPINAAQGIARALLYALEDKARELGYAIARLDTGPKQGAQGLYESEGYAEIENFNGNRSPVFWARSGLLECRSRSCRRPGIGMPAAGVGRARS